MSKSQCLLKIVFAVKMPHMSKNVNLGAIMRHCAKKQESAFLNLKDFCDYLKKYSARHLENHPELVQYLEISEASLLKELEDYAARHEIYILHQFNSKVVIIVLTYYSAYFAEIYKEIIAKITVPFPVPQDLPKNIPADAIEKHDATELIERLSEKQDTKSPSLYCLIFPRDVPSILFPESVPVHILLSAAVFKIRNMLRKDEYRDYFQKKLCISNPNKEISARSFFKSFLQQQDKPEEHFELEGDDFYYWSQLCYFIRQDFEKVKDRTAEDTNILQAISITDVWLMSMREKIAKNKYKEEAFAELEKSLSRPPYFFNMEAILRMKDSKGVLLYGQYNDEELKDFLKKLTTETVADELPKLLVFKIEGGESYFIYKNMVFPLIVRLANEAHDVIEKDLIDKWVKAFRRYERLPEMKDNKAFEKALKTEVAQKLPALHSLLTSNFLMILNYEADHSSDSFAIFSGGRLLSYAHLLMLNNSSILARTRLMLPFWYTMPVVSWFANLFFRKKESDTSVNVLKNLSSENIAEDGTLSGSHKPVSRKEVIADAAKKISKSLISPGSTLDRELDSYLKQWNKMITKEGHRQLTEDVNTLIRDYMRKVIKTISAATFTQERVQSLAETLCKTPNMQKINGGDALFMYVQLYILRLVSNK